MPGRETQHQIFGLLLVLLTGADCQWNDSDVGYLNESTLRPDLPPLPEDYLIINIPYYSNCNITTLSGHEIYLAPDQSCLGLCNYTGNDRIAPCHCLEECIIYGDCCLDYEAVCLQSEDKTPNFIRRFQDQRFSKMECITVGGDDRLLVIARCPSEGPETGIRELCEGGDRQVDARTDLIRSMPYVQQDLIYANVYCAICWGVASVGDIDTLGDTVEIKCGVYSEFIETSETPEEYFALVKSKCTFNPKIKPPDHKLRYCREDSPTYADLLVHDNNNTEMCLSYSARVFDEDANTMYRNIHCARIVDPEVYRFDCIDRNYYYPGNLMPPILVSFAMLLDLRRSPRTLVTVGGNETCPDNFTRSPGMELCTSPPLCRDGDSDDCWEASLFVEYLDRKRVTLKEYTFTLNTDPTIDTWFVTSSLHNFQLSPYVKSCPFDVQNLAQGNQTCTMVSFKSFRTLKWVYKMIETSILDRSMAYIYRWFLSLDEFDDGDYEEVMLNNCSVISQFRRFLNQVIIGIPVRLDGSNASWCIIHEKQTSLNCSDVRVAILSNETGALPVQSFNISETTAFICVDDSLTKTQGVDVEGILTIVCLSLSISSLLLCLCVYTLLPSLRTVPGRCVMCLCSALLIAQVLLQFGSNGRTFRSLCIALAALDHWAWLASFSWMVILAYDISSTMSREMLTDGHLHARPFRSYLALAWGIPTVVVSVCVGIAIERPEWLSYTDGVVCWISSGMTSLLLTFALPLTITLVLNTAFFIRTLLAIRRTVKVAEHAKDASQAQSLLGVYVRLASLMGFTWVLGLLQNALPYAAMRYAFITCNALQGVSIMVAFVCKQRVLRMLRARFQGKKKYFPPSSARNTTKTSA